jgi:hypothetical protein
VPFCRHQAFQQQVQHLARMAQTPGWRAYARARAVELEADQSGLFVGLVDAVRSVLATGGPAKPGVCADPNPVKPR